ncbi:MAG: cupin domain-containing protein [Lentisphaerae bacterium]|nr:cupin domain-containing protein [Lentisphaerota bacterium]
MDELDKGLSISLTGAARDAALRRFEATIAAWGVAMPTVEPLVLDFGLGQFEKIGLIEFWIANELAAGYCGKYLYLEAGQSCPRHRHRGKHETFFIVKGRVRMEYDGEVREMGPGDVLPVALWHYHSFTGLTAALLLEVSQPCEIEDNFFEDTRIPIGGNHDG